MQVLGDDAAGHDADDRARGARRPGPEVGRRDARRPHAAARDRRDGAARGEGRVVHHHAAAEHQARMAALQRVERDDVGAPARGDQAAVRQSEDARGGVARGAVHRQRLRTQGERRADHVVQVPMLGDVERVAVIRAEGEERRVPLRDQGREGVQVARHRPLPDQHRHPLRQLLQRLRSARRLVVGADAGREVAVQVHATQQRRVAVDVPPLEGAQLGEAARVAREHARVVHELGQADHLRMVRDLQQVRRVEPRAGGLHARRRHAARELDAQVHHGALGRLQEVADALHARDVGDLVRVADRRRHAAGRDAALELEGRDEGGFDVQVRVDEAGHENEARDVDLAPAAVAAERADDAVAADRHVARQQRARDQVEDPPALQHQLGRFGTPPLPDRRGKIESRPAHAVASPLSGILRQRAGRCTGKPGGRRSRSGEAPYTAPSAERSAKPRSRAAITPPTASTAGRRAKRVRQAIRTVRPARAASGRRVMPASCAAPAASPGISVVP
jgi:hypothetical protein